MEPSFNRWIRVLGHGILTAGLALLLQPTLGGMAAAFALGLLVGLLKLPRLATLDLIFPIVAAFVVASLVFTVSHHTDLGDNPVRILIPPLVTFLPGGVLTIATVELAAGQMIAGASRLVTGMVQLGLLAFGIVAASSLIGVDQQLLIDNPINRLGPWAPWIGVLIFALGDYLHFSAPSRSLFWILLVLLRGLRRSGPGRCRLRRRAERLLRGPGHDPAGALDQRPAVRHPVARDLPPGVLAAGARRGRPHRGDRDRGSRPVRRRGGPGHRAHVDREHRPRRADRVGGLPHGYGQRAAGGRHPSPLPALPTPKRFRRRS